MSWPFTKLPQIQRNARHRFPSCFNEGRSRHCALHAHEVIHGLELDDESSDLYRNSKNCAIYTV